MINRQKVLRCLFRSCLRYKFQRDGVDAVPCVFGRKAFAFENVSQMAAAICADDFNAPSVGIGHTLYRAGNFVVKRRPAAVRFKLVLRTIKRCVATAANVCAGFFMICVFTGERTFGAFAEYDPFFFGCKWVELHGKRLGV